MLCKTKFLNLSKLPWECYLENTKKNTKKYFNVVAIGKINFNDYNVSKYSMLQ